MLYEPDYKSALVCEERYWHRVHLLLLYPKSTRPKSEIGDNVPNDYGRDVVVVEAQRARRIPNEVDGGGRGKAEACPDL